MLHVKRSNTPPKIYITDNMMEGLYNIIIKVLSAIRNEMTGTNEEEMNAGSDK